MTFRKVGEHVTRTIAGETLVVPIRAAAAELDSLYVFNETGAAIWTLLDVPRDVDEIAHAVAAEFDVAAGPARADVVQFLEMLQAAGLVEGQPAP